MCSAKLGSSLQCQEDTRAPAPSGKRSLWRYTGSLVSALPAPAVPSSLLRDQRLLSRTPVAAGCLPALAAKAPPPGTNRDPLGTAAWMHGRLGAATKESTDGKKDRFLTLDQATQLFAYLTTGVRIHEPDEVRLPAELRQFHAFRHEVFAPNAFTPESPFWPPRTPHPHKATELQ